MYWYENKWSNYRDPGFFKENGTCYMVHTAHTWAWKGAIALATSTDYFTWHDAGPIYVADNWHAIESVFLMKRNGRYHLFFTEETTEGISHMSSDSLRSGWNIATRTIIDLGAASEVLDLGDDRYIISRHTKYTTAAEPVSSIRFDTLGWYGDQPHVQMTNLLGGWTILWGTAFDRQPVFGDNPRYRGDFVTTIGFEGNWWIGTYERFNGPISGPMPGGHPGESARGAIRSETFSRHGLLDEAPRRRRQLSRLVLRRPLRRGDRRHPAAERRGRTPTAWTSGSGTSPPTGEDRPISRSSTTAYPRSATSTSTGSRSV